MKTRMIVLLAILLLSIDVSSQQVLTKFKDAQAIAIASNKPIVINTWYTNNETAKIVNLKYLNDPEVKKLIENFVVLELVYEKPYSDDVKYLMSVNDHAFLGGNVKDPLGNTLGRMQFPIGKNYYAYNKLGDKDKLLKSLKRMTLNLAPMQEDYRAIAKLNDANSKVSLAEKYLNYSIYIDWREAKDNLVYIATKYVGDLQKNQPENLSAVSKQKLILLDSYKDILNGKHKKAAKEINSLNLSDILEENKSMMYYLGFISNNKSKKKEIAKVWFYKLKERPDFNFYHLMSRKL